MIDAARRRNWRGTPALSRACSLDAADDDGRELLDEGFARVQKVIQCHVFERDVWNCADILDVGRGGEGPD